jgi:hypothetical protein
LIDAVEYFFEEGRQWAHTIHHGKGYWTAGDREKDGWKSIMEMNESKVCGRGISIIADEA